MLQERRGGAHTDPPTHRPDQAHISQSETIYAGEVIGFGTVGTGCGFELGRELKHGDVVELEIEKIGILRNRVVRS